MKRLDLILFEPYSAPWIEEWDTTVLGPRRDRTTWFFVRWQDLFLLGMNPTWRPGE